MKLQAKVLEENWKKVSPVKKGADDKFLKAIHGRSYPILKVYDRDYMKDVVSGDNAQNDANRYRDALEGFIADTKKIEKELVDSADPKQKPKVQAFLNDVISSARSEVDFWKKPIQEQLPPLPEKNLRKLWSDRKAQVEAQAPPGVLKIKFSEGLGPALDKFEKAQKSADRVKYGKEALTIVNKYKDDVKKKVAQPPLQQGFLKVLDRTEKVLILGMAGLLK